MDPRNMAAYMAEILRGQSHAELIGPIADAGGENGLVLRAGEVVEEWGDVERADMCFSVAKSFLSAVAGLAFDRGLIADVHEPVVDGELPPAAYGNSAGLVADRPTPGWCVEINAPGAELPVRHGCPDGIRLRRLR
jgi:hypothetical protein